MFRETLNFRMLFAYVLTPKLLHHSTTSMSIPLNLCFDFVPSPIPSLLFLQVRIVARQSRNESVNDIPNGKI